MSEDNGDDSGLDPKIKKLYKREKRGETSYKASADPRNKRIGGQLTEETFNLLKQVADAERRSMSAQMEIILEDWLSANAARIIKKESREEANKPLAAVGC